MDDSNVIPFPIAGPKTIHQMLERWSGHKPYLEVAGSLAEIRVWPGNLTRSDTSWFVGELRLIATDLSRSLALINDAISLAPKPKPRGPKRPRAPRRK